jgi:hypothetical protein
MSRDDEPEEPQRADEHDDEHDDEHADEHAEDAPASGDLVLPSKTARRDAIAACVSVTVATALVMSYAFAPENAGSPGMLGAIFGLDLAVAIVSLARLHRTGELRAVMRLRPGDIWLGGMLAGLMYGGAMAGHLVLTPHLSPREGWIMRLYLQLGDPRGEGRELVGLAVFVVASLEEIAWRGLVMRALVPVTGGARALVISSALFALAHAPTLWLLGDPVAGPNPLIVLAALCCSVIWGGLMLRTRRLVPSIVAHALFSWAIVEFPIWRL